MVQAHRSVISNTHHVAPSCTGVPAPCYTTVQAAVDAARDGDDVKVAGGTYTGVQGRAAPPGYPGPSVITQVVYISKTVTIRGGYATDFADPPDPAANPTTLDAQSDGRVLFITGEISPTVEGLRITGGDADGLGGSVGGYGYPADDGGGLYIKTATATISNCQVFSNTAEAGGGLFFFNSAATISGNTVSSNASELWGGGGLYLSHSDATLSGNTVTTNTVIGGVFVENGGGVYLSGSDATLSENIISGNTASENGGGLYLDNSNATLSANTVTANSARRGGGLHLNNSGGALSDNTVSSNSASEGGGVYLSGSDATLAGNSIFSNNAGRSGGGLYLSDSDAPLVGNSVLSNTAEWGDGGGLYLSNSAATLNGNLIRGNAATDPDAGGGGLYLLWNSDATLVNNLVVDNWANSHGSGVYIGTSSPRLLHTTLARNSGGDGSAVFVAPGSDWDRLYSTVAMTNTILVNHAVGIDVTAGNTATLESTLWGAGAWANGTDWGGGGTISTGTVNLWGNPDFLDPDSGDYHIGPDSVALDVGVNAGVATDVDGQTRPYGHGYDIGADEYWPSVEDKYIYLPLVLRASP
jgi:parallel beta-helix repeat protein